MSPDRVPPQLVVGAAVVDHLASPTRLLAARRTAPSALAGGWELPGGKVEPGEEPEAALHREVREELGVAVRLGPEAVAPDPDGWPLGGGMRLRVWWAVVTAGEPRPLQDHDAIRWVPLTEPLAVAWLAGDVPVVEALSRTATGGGPSTRRG